MDPTLFAYYMQAALSMQNDPYHALYQLMLGIMTQNYCESFKLSNPYGVTALCVTLSYEFLKQYFLCSSCNGHTDDACHSSAFSSGSHHRDDAA